MSGGGIIEVQEGTLIVQKTAGSVDTAEKTSVTAFYDKISNQRGATPELSTKHIEEAIFAYDEVPRRVEIRTTTQW